MWNALSNHSHGKTAGSGACLHVHCAAASNKAMNPLVAATLRPRVMADVMPRTATINLPRHSRWYARPAQALGNATTESS